MFSLLSWFMIPQAANFIFHISLNWMASYSIQRRELLWKIRPKLHQLFDCTYIIMAWYSVHTVRKATTAVLGLGLTMWSWTKHEDATHFGLRATQTKTT